MKIMLAEDYAPLRSILHTWLEQEPTFQVIAEVEEAVTLVAQAQRTQPDVILLDWELRGLRTDHAGRQLIMALHVQSPHLRVVAMSTQPEAKQQALATGADAFVSKNEAPDRLLATLQRLHFP